MRPSQTNLVLEELRKSFAAILRRGDVVLSDDDSQTVMDVYQQWILLLTDLGYLHPGVLLRDARRIWSDMIRKDVLDLNNACAECLHAIRVQNFRGFKGLCCRISSHLYHLIKADIELVQAGDVRSARRLVQVFAYTSRLSLRDLDLTQQMLDEYMETEGLIPSQFPSRLVQRLNTIIRWWMKPFDPSGIHAQHGRKGVAFLGRASLEIKYKNLTSDQMLRYAFGEPDWIVSPIPATLDRISETTFVPKSYKTFRTISMESPTLMYFQQGVWLEIDRLVGCDPYLRKHIGFHEQDRNKSLAQEGSLHRNYATIDLSAASDSVSYELVKSLFAGTKLLRFLVATRSRRTLLPDGQLIWLKKFAPMGSALCFPVETIIFAAVCELVTQEHRIPGKYSVYGDDIIVPTQCVERALEILKKLGFRVNHSKSFVDTTCWFRESCGGEYCDGFDVTPLRVSRKYSSVEHDERLMELIDLANESYKRNFRNLRLFLINQIRKMGYKPLFAPTALLADNYTNYHADKRWNAGLQRVEVAVSRLATITSKKARSTQDETIRYRHWLATTSRRKPDNRKIFPVEEDCFISVICKTTVSIQGTWAEKPYELPDQEFIDSRRRLRLNTRSQ